jgi:methyl-accepting chemotaxis protein
MSTQTDTTHAPALPSASQDQAKLADLQAQLDALRRSQAVIEFELDGTILDANANFLSALGYTRDEIVGKHHSMFIDAEYRASAEYRRFWTDLAAGKFFAGEFKRLGKGGREVWIQASYNPVLDASGRAYKVVKFAADITAAKLQAADWLGQIDAISKSQAVIEFELDGTIRTANANFLGALGYSLNEIVGKHHSMFISAEHRASAEYRRFWPDLAAGKFQRGEFMRLAKGGREIWIQATYNPILDPSGRPCKVVKFATDITAQVAARRDQEIVEKVRVVSTRLAESSRHLTNVTTQIATDATESSNQARGVAAAAEQVARNNQTVAAAIEEMTSSIKSISGSTADAAKVAGQAVSMSRQTNETISKLGESSREIGKVIKTITEIAQQTNLLALNATIESARAGESGKGFAVVANEVKQLAKQSAHASEDIARRIESIQADTKLAVDAIGEIGRIIEQINGLQTSIAGAVEEQTAVTGEIGRNLSEAVRAGEEIASSINAVARAAESTTTGVQSARTSVDGLNKMATELDRLVK